MLKYVSKSSSRNRAIVMACLGILTLFSLALSVLSPLTTKPVSAGIFAWTAVDTPSSINNVVVLPSEVNSFAIAPDGFTIYALDIPDTNSSGGRGKLYRSRDGGVTWPDDLSPFLVTAGAFTPIWMVAIAPDNPNFIVVVTDAGGSAGGPQFVYFSSDAGATWHNTNFVAPALEFISCLDISLTYGGNNRDIAIGTRTGTGTGKVYTAEYAAIIGSTWNPQDTTGGSTGWADGDVIAVKFSPNYPSDSGLVAVSADAPPSTLGTTGTRLQLGTHDSNSNFTAWNFSAGYPILVEDPAFAPPSPSPDASQIVTGQIQLPSDFSATTNTLRRIYISTDPDNTANVQAGLYRVDDTVVYRINPPTLGRISSISYYGTYAEGTILVGEVTADPATAMVNVWRSVNCTCAAPGWVVSERYKSPTGGGNSGLANAQVAWSPDGTRAYCGTSSACLGPFKTPDGTIVCTVLSEWPDGYLNSGALDESAFSVSPYAPAYSQLLTSGGKDLDTDIGNIWNQLSLIDTEMGFLTDVAVLQAPANTEEHTEYDILYVSSNSNNLTVTFIFNSIWRSTGTAGSILGRTWERVLCTPANATGDVPILRVKQTSYEDEDRSDVIVFANLNTDIVGYSANEGQLWEIRPFTNVTDLALSDDDTMFILNDILIYEYERAGTGWSLTHKVDTELNSGHSISVPLKNPPRADGELANMVVVGESGPPLGSGRILYADFSQSVVSGGPLNEDRIDPPVIGDAHPIFDDHYDTNGIIYNAISTPLSTPGIGKIYRWIVGKAAWDELEPPNADFYGLAQRNDVLYGAWKTPEVPEIIFNNAGVDRTLYPRINVPPPPEWDYLVSELPIAVLFNREPSSLKISSNDFNTLWAIDNRGYDYAAIEGRLWTYEDPASKVGPFTTAPPSGSEIPVDPKTGRAVEINFAWRQISYATVYELQIAKDADFYNRVLVNENIVPADQLSPTVYTPAGALIPVSGSNIGSWANLESGHTYYWRVRARGTITGEVIRSPWSATMYFTVEAGLPTASRYPTIELFNPTYGCQNASATPGFSWSPLPGTTKYEFVLAKDAAMQQIVVKAEVPSTSYLYNGKLDAGKTYYWQVRAIEPVVSDPSPTGYFTVLAASKPTTPITQEPPMPVWIWGVIATVAAVVLSLILFATLGGRVYNRPSGGRLFKVEPIAEKPKESTVDKSIEPVLNKPKNSLSRFWESTVTALKRVKLFKKQSDKGPGDNPDKLT